MQHPAIPAGALEEGAQTRTPGFSAGSLLTECKLRPTLARLSVLELFRDAQAYTPEQVYRALVRQGSDVSLATTYRTLAQFVDAGLLNRQQLDSGPGRYFLPTSQPGEHMLCTECGALLPMPGPEIAGLLRMLAARQGYLLAEYELSLQGKCMECARKGADCEGSPRNRDGRAAAGTARASLK